MQDRQAVQKVGSLLWLPCRPLLFAKDMPAAGSQRWQNVATKRRPWHGQEQGM